MSPWIHSPWTSIQEIVLDHLISAYWLGKCFSVYLWLSGVLQRNISQQQILKPILYRAVMMCVYIKWLHKLLCSLISCIWLSYLACHIAYFCMVAAVLLRFKQVLTGWLSYGWFPLNYFICPLFLLFCLSLHLFFFLSSLLCIPLPFICAGLQMSGFPKVSSLPLCDCTLLLLLFLSIKVVELTS